MCRVKETKSVENGFTTKFLQTGKIQTGSPFINENTKNDFVRMLAQLKSISDFADETCRMIGENKAKHFSEDGQLLIEHSKRISKQCVVAGCLKCLNVCSRVF